MRKLVAAIGVVLLAVSLGGCSTIAAKFGQTVEPWVIADHDAKVRFHAGAGEQLLGVNVTEQFLGLEAYQATGYTHFATGEVTSNAQFSTSVAGEAYVSTMATNVPGYSIDQSHQQGSATTYYLLGDELKQTASEGKSWVSVPLGDLGLRTSGASHCYLFAISYACSLLEAWNATKAANAALPVQLSTSETNEQLFTTAVSLNDLDDAGLLPTHARWADFFGTDDARATLVPLRVWVDADGLVTKIEANATLTGAGEQTAKLQVGYELTGRSASAPTKPVTPDEVPPGDVLELHTSDEVDAFVKRLGV